MIPSVLHVVVSLAPGGLERLVVEWVNARNAQHPDSTAVCCLDQPGVLAADIADAEVIALGARRGRFPWDGQAAAALASLAGGYGVLHSHNLAAHQYAALAARKSRVPLVHTEHGTNPHIAGLKNRLRLRLLARQTQRLVAVSGHTRAAMCKAWHVPQDRVHVIANGVSPHPEGGAARRVALREAMGIPAGATVIGSVGRLAAVKGYDRLLRCFATLRQMQGAPTALRLVLIGEGPERERLETLARELGVEAAVCFMGHRDDARAYYDVMDVFTLSSHSEGLSLSLLEAMASGCAALVTDVGESARVVDEGRAGQLLPADESAWPAAFMACITALSDASGSARRAAAMDRVAAHYSLAGSLAAYEALYQEVI